MWGAIIRHGLIAAPFAFGFALIGEKVLGVALTLMKDAPESGGSPLIEAVSAMQSNLLLLFIVAILIQVLAQAHLEAKLGGV